MRVRRPLSVAVGTAAVAAAVAGATPAAGLGAAAAASPARPAVLIAPDAVHASPGDTGGAPSTGYCETHYQIACYTPQQVRAAYHVGPLYQRGITGQGQTIVIVDSFGSPTVRRDLARFDTQFGLAAPPSLKIIQPAGAVPPYRATSTREGWAGETDLDVEYAHAMAPGARILLVETPTSEEEGTTGFPQIVTAENYVISHRLGGVISQSFSATEQTFPSRQSLLRLRSAYQNAASHGVTVLAASGDSGAADVKFNETTYYLHPVTSWPDSDPLVTGVGGTQLHLPASGHAGPAAVWNDTYNAATSQYIVGGKGPAPLAAGGGKSVIFARPSYQYGVRGVVGARRGIPDISMSAACNGAVDMYQSFPGQTAGWYPTCGTSEATPLFAGIVALAGQVAGHPLGPINPALYAMAAHRAAGIVDVTTGNNTVSFRQGGKLHTVRGFRAAPGYDLASGLGTIDAASFVPELAAAAGS